MLIETLLLGLPLLRLFFVLHVGSGHSFPKPLSAKRERECLEQIRAGDNDAKNELIEHNLRLVVHIIKNGVSARRIFCGQRRPRTALRFSDVCPSGFPLWCCPFSL